MCRCRMLRLRRNLQRRFRRAPTAVAPPAPPNPRPTWQAPPSEAPAAPCFVRDCLSHRDRRKRRPPPEPSRLFQPPAPVQNSSPAPTLPIMRGNGEPLRKASVPVPAGPRPPIRSTPAIADAGAFSLPKNWRPCFRWILRKPPQLRRRPPGSGVGSSDLRRVYVGRRAGVALCWRSMRIRAQNAVDWSQKRVCANSPGRVAGRRRKRTEPSPQSDALRRQRYGGDRFRRSRLATMALYRITLPRRRRRTRSASPPFERIGRVRRKRRSLRRLAPPPAPRMMPTTVPVLPPPQQVRRRPGRKRWTSPLQTEIKPAVGETVDDLMSKIAQPLAQRHRRRGEAGLRRRGEVYEEIKRLPPQAWPMGLDLRLEAAPASRLRSRSKSIY